MTANHERDITRHVTSTTRILLFSVIAALSLSVAAAAVTSSTAMCASCHEMEPFVQAYADSTHAATSCYACHMSGGWWGFPAQKASEFFGMYPAHFSKETSEGIWGPSTRMQPEQCLDCHEVVMERKTDSAGLRIRHSSCAHPPTSCSTCHSAVVHGSATRWISEPVMDDCVLCHAELEAPMDCDTCHAGRSKTERLSKAPWSTTHGPRWETTHGAGDLRTCIVCHDEERCVGCHGTPIPHPRGFYNTHGEEAQAEDAGCFVCHDKATLCDECHGTQMPHPDGFLEEHSKIARSREDSSCLEVCHSENDCVTCHTKHTHPGTTDGTLRERLRDAQGVFE